MRPSPGCSRWPTAARCSSTKIGDLPLSLQAKLLRVLEDKQIRRVGGTKSRTIDVRILAATDEHLSERVRDGGFREDLYFRFDHGGAAVPPLRDRGDDVALIAAALLQRLAAEHDLPVPTLTPAMLGELRAHSWPGTKKNIREAENAVERALLLSPRRVGAPTSSGPPRNTGR